MVPSSTTELMDTTEQTNANVDDDRLTLNNVIFAGSGHSKCVICRQETRRWMISMPKSARLDLLIIHLMYAPNGVRCCPSHLLNNNRLLPDVEISSVFNIPGTSEDGRKRAADAFDSVRQCLIEKFVPRHLGVQHLTREDAKKQNTSFSIEFFGNNVTIIWDGTYLYMGKSSVFNIPGNSEDRRKRAADAFDSVRQCLIEKFVPRHLGVQHLTREDAKK
ncbi:unnamed protein product [Rotaria sordida]|uniref:Uncharacterized protein n=1 Tax=Rotaria sordida TaxID=392033 RepID=A0A815I6T1_9BILA|nr:unnamed protein product [Rotaria sordida]